MTLRLLFLSSRHAVRGQIAEALLHTRGKGCFEVRGAAYEPAAAVHPMTIESLRTFGIDWTGHRPRPLDDVRDERWDLVIAVCDRDRESCPAPLREVPMACWGVEDPLESSPLPEARERAFRQTIHYLARRIDLLLALPPERQMRLITRMRGDAPARWGG